MIQILLAHSICFFWLALVVPCIAQYYSRLCGQPFRHSRDILRDISVNCFCKLKVLSGTDSEPKDQITPLFM